MRFLLTLLGLVVLLAAVGVMTGYINIFQTRAGVVQAPSFHADVGSVSVGHQTKTVEVPTIAVRKPGENSAVPAQ